MLESGQIDFFSERTKHLTIWSGTDQRNLKCDQIGITKDLLWVLPRFHFLGCPITQRRGLQRLVSR